MLFLLAVALATYAQTMTGFAFGLVLLGLSSLAGLAPLPDMSNTVSILTLINALVAIGRNRPQVNWALLRPALISSLVGVALGVAALDLIHGRLSVILQWLLGLTILVCAFMLVMQARQLAQISSRRVFLSFGLVSGLLGGLFSSAGPPMVYQLYRQPLPLAVIHNSLLVLFAANAVVRLSLVTWQGSIHVNTLWMSLEALPVVVILTMLVRRFASAHAIRSVKRMVFVLLIAAGLGLFVPASRTLLQMIL
ncbi:sulfite exporter TauE/SafE family protein [Bordetella holmesii 30539]|uniref:Probable membrane transporter protein n=2 Tax=Bordetella holmesii TaxID=35814 RepID=A0A158LZH6_9BORD|nr:sulfite exporter TauE/SafE family protein [Bordetella holmesii ATCC 51541]EWM46036.1 sulfite exporter TauE/SafE family protein [Bordetella holmesii 35009]EXF89100.1 sulfite exporter TauE/SafE family protein [Bordetella holmesii 30539]EXX95305.1 sulfite exporter TauE/SafE family protein [Bordetella holmesii 1058]KAK81702.1 sulfite exporter TauE/SafE [Bordetella holmesii H620]KAK83120.1 sulfite exporter TauE/SafE [Bordetella holmesii CDC-H809-BH]KAK86658.1 sulfite exporter TauE/SafE [Bordete